MGGLLGIYIEIEVRIVNTKVNRVMCAHCFSTDTEYIKNDLYTEKIAMEDWKCNNCGKEFKIKLRTEY